MTTYLLTLEGDSVVCQIENAADVEKLRAHGVTVVACDDQTAMAALLLDMHPQARGLMESGLVRSLERLGRAAEVAALLASVPDVPTFGDEERYLNPFWGGRWEMTAAKAEPYHIPDSGPNAGRQAPPPRREWWIENDRIRGKTKLGRCQRDKGERNRQKDARRKQR